MRFLMLAALLPGLYWDHGADTAARLKSAGILRIYVPAARVDEWRAAGLMATEFVPSPPRCKEAEAPRVDMRMNVASATTAPWIIANGWKFQRSPGGTWCYQTPAGGASLAAAEAFAYAVDAVITPADQDVDEFARMLAFLRHVDRPPMRGMANIGVVDDGSESTAEVLNLLARRNLLFRVLMAPDPQFELNVTPKDVADPYEYATELRRKLGDDHRWVRLYGSEVVLARLTGDGPRARLHLLNYSHRPVLGLRVRVRGEWKIESSAIYGYDKAAPQEFAVREGGTEFTVAEMGPYAVFDLQK